MGDVYSIIDDGVMMAQLQNDIFLIKDYPYTLPTPAYPHNTKEEKAINDEWWQWVNESMTMGLVINLLCRI